MTSTVYILLPQWLMLCYAAKDSSCDFLNVSKTAYCKKDGERTECIYLCTYKDPHNDTAVFSPCRHIKPAQYVESLKEIYQMLLTNYGTVTAKNPRRKQAWALLDEKLRKPTHFSEEICAIVDHLEVHKRSGTISATSIPCNASLSSQYFCKMSNISKGDVPNSGRNESVKDMKEQVRFLIVLLAGLATALAMCLMLLLICIGCFIRQKKMVTLIRKRSQSKQASKHGTYIDMNEHNVSHLYEDLADTDTRAITQSASPGMERMSGHVNPLYNSDEHVEHGPTSEESRSHLGENERKPQAIASEKENRILDESEIL